MSDRLILFISPNKSGIINQAGNPVQKHRSSVSLPGLTILGALENGGFECEFIDLSVLSETRILKKTNNVVIYGESILDNREKICELNPRFVLITSIFSFEQFIVDKIVVELKMVLPESIIILGGIHASIKPEWHFEISNPNFIVLGDGEETIVELIKELISDYPQLNKVKGIAYKRNGKIIKNAGREKLRKLNQPWAYQRVLLNESGEYRYNDIECNKHPIYLNKDIKNQNAFSLFGSRGCPMKCNFCPSSYRDGSICRHMTTDYLFDQFLLLRNQYKVSIFSNQSDTFAFTEEGLLFLELISQYRKETGDVEFILNNPNAFFLNQFFHNRSYQINIGFIYLLKNAGFNIITIAIETTIKRFNNKVNWSNISFGKIIDLFKELKKIGLRTDVYMMYGFEDQTEKEFYKDLRFADMILPWVDLITWHGLALLPGSYYYFKHVEKKNKENEYRRLLKSGYSFFQPSEEFNLTNISANKLYENVKPFGQSWL